MSYDVIRSAILISLFQLKLPMINQCKIKPESLNGVKDYDRPALTSLRVLNVNWPDSHNHLREQHPKYIVILLRKLKAAKYEIQKPSTWRATLFRCKFGSISPVFHLA